MSDIQANKKLKKELSLFGVFALATGATLSSGLFLLPGLAAEQVHSTLVLVYFLAVLPLIPGILCKIELATAMPRAGGEYYFLDRSLGPLIGTISGFGTWASLVLKSSFALVGLGAYLHLLWPDAPTLTVAAGIAVVLGVLNLFGAQKSSAIQAVLVVVLLALLSWFSAVGVTNVESTHFEGFLDFEINDLMMAAGMVVVSYMGLTKVASVAEEVKNPERNLPLGILLAMGVSLLVYGVGTYVLVGVLENVRYDEVTAKYGLYKNMTPVASAAEKMMGVTGKYVMSIAAILAFLSVANAGILSASRYPLAMSRDQLLPKSFRKLNKNKVPVVGVILTVGTILFCVLGFDPMKIAKLASTFLLILFAFNCIAVIVMRESHIASYDPGFRTPLYPWVPLLGILGPLLFIIVMGWLPMTFALGLIAIGAVWYFYYAKSRVNRGGAIFHLFARLGQMRFEGLDRELRGILKEKGLRDQDPYDQVVASAAVVDMKKHATFEEITTFASEQLAFHLPKTAEDLTELFMKGTRIGATPITKGVALPHIHMKGIDKPHMVLCRVNLGVHIEVDTEYLKHLQEENIYAVIFLVSPEEDAAQHLRILAHVAQHLDRSQFMTGWRNADNEHELRNILLRDERFLTLHVSEDGPTSEWEGLALKGITWPDGVLIALIHRIEQTIFPRGSTVLHMNDRLTLVGEPEVISYMRENYLGDKEQLEYIDE